MDNIECLCVSRSVPLKISLKSDNFFLNRTKLYKPKGTFCINIHPRRSRFHVKKKKSETAEIFIKFYDFKEIRFLV